MKCLECRQPIAVVMYCACENDRPVLALGDCLRAKLLDENRFAGNGAPLLENGWEYRLAEEALRFLAEHARQKANAAALR